MRSFPVILVEPPLYDCRAPHLGCAMLSASLRDRGRDIQIVDLNLEAVLWLLKKDGLERARDKVAGRRTDLMARAKSLQADHIPMDPNDRYSLWRCLSALRCENGFAELVARSVTALRDSNQFYQPRTHRASRAVIDTALDLQALACDEKLHMSLCPQQYNGRYRATLLGDLFAAAQDPSGNPFLPFFDRVAVPNLLAAQPCLVGISISNVFQVIPGITLAKMLHDLHILVVIGGPFFSKFGPRLAQLPEFFDLCDAVALGEGEETLGDLVEATAEGSDLSLVPNLLYRSGHQVVATSIRVSSQVPDPVAADFTKLPLAEYLIPEPVLPIYAGKGCPWGRCTFCEIPQINTLSERPRRVRPPHRVVEEMQTQAGRHGARHFVFTDESLEPELLASIANGILQARLDVHYLGYTRFSEAYDRQLCERLAQSGCSKLLFGLESGCQSVNNQCRKGVNLARVPAIVDACQQAGIAVHVFSIIGLPGEGAAEAGTSAEYLAQLADQLNLPISTMDVSAFYLNWNSWLRRHAAEAGVHYETNQDFPLHVDDYRLDDGMDARVAQKTADQVYRQLCWHASAPGLDIGYRNPAWPGWEEYTLLYSSRYAAQKDRGYFIWPRTEQELLNMIVAVPQPLVVYQLPFSLHALGTGNYGQEENWLALTPAGEATELTKRVRRVLPQHGQYKVSDLVDQLCYGSGSGEQRADALAQVVDLIQRGILQW